MNINALISKINQFYKLAVFHDVDYGPASFNIFRGTEHITPELVNDSNLESPFKTDINDILVKKHEFKVYLVHKATGLLSTNGRIISNFKKFKTDIIWMLNNFIDSISNKFDTSIAKKHLSDLRDWIPTEDVTKSNLIQQLNKFNYLIHELISYLFQQLVTSQL